MQEGSLGHMATTVAADALTEGSSQFSTKPCCRKTRRCVTPAAIAGIPEGKNWDACWQHAGTMVCTTSNSSSSCQTSARPGRNEAAMELPNGIQNYRCVCEIIAQSDI
jgi:hypothetical protein